MSLNSLAANRVSRDRASATAAAARSSGRASTSAGDDNLGPDANDVQNALSALVEYVPAETITLYLATMASLAVLQEAIAGLTAATVYWAFVAMTPILFALIYAGKRNAAGESRWPGFKKWPWWPMVAATVAFMAWGITVPNGPYLADASGQVISGLLAIFVSTILGVLGRLFSASSG